MLSDLKISTRLAWGFGFMGLLIALMGATSLLLANGANRSFHQVVDDRLPKVLSLHTAKEDVLAMELGLNRLAAQLDGATTRTQEARVAELREQINVLLQTLERQITSAQGRDLMARTLGARGTYERELERFFALLQAGDASAAAEQLNRAMEAPRSAYFAALDALIAY